MRIQNKSERRIGMNVPGKAQFWFEIGVNDVPDADWKAGKDSVEASVDRGDLVEVTAKAAAAPVPEKTEQKTETKAAK